MILVEFGDKIGQFVFPKEELIRQKIISTDQTSGKMAFRVYPVWDHPTNKQGIKTQKWQSVYFQELNLMQKKSSLRTQQLYK